MAHRASPGVALAPEREVVTLLLTSMVTDSLQSSARRNRAFTLDLPGHGNMVSGKQP